MSKPNELSKSSSNGQTQKEIDQNVDHVIKRKRVFCKIFPS